MSGAAGDFNTSPYRGVFQKKDEAKQEVLDAYGIDNLRPLYRLLTRGDLPAGSTDGWYGREVQVNKDEWSGQRLFQSAFLQCVGEEARFTESGHKTLALDGGSCLDFIFFVGGTPDAPDVTCMSVMNPMRTGSDYIDTEGLPNEHYSSDHLPIGIVLF